MMTSLKNGLTVMINLNNTENNTKFNLNAINLHATVHANDAPSSSDAPKATPQGAKPDANPPKPPANEPPDLETVWRELVKKVNELLGKTPPSNRPSRLSSAALSPPKIHHSKQNTPTRIQPSQQGQPVANSQASILSKVPTLNPVKLTGATLSVLLSIWFATGFYGVPEGHVAVISQFGEPIETRLPGLGWHLPYPIQSDTVVDIAGIRKIHIGAPLTAKNSTANDKNKHNLMLTADENLLNVQFEVQYRLKDNAALAYVLTYMSPQLQLASYESINRQADPLITLFADSVMREELSRHLTDTVFNADRTLITKSVHTRLQQRLDAYQFKQSNHAKAPFIATGVYITAVNIVSVRPPEALQASFDAVIQAAQEKDRVISDSKSLASEMVLQAKAKAAQTLIEAKDYKQSVIKRAEGDIARFKPIQAEYLKYPELTRQRLYLETMQEVLQSTNKVMIDAKTNNNTLYIPLDKLSALTPLPAAAALSSKQTPPVVADSSKTEPAVVDKAVRANEDKDLKEFR
jgi:modulator of FtsH protease HflK